MTFKTVPSSAGAEMEYPSPPRVHWLVLLSAGIVLSIAISWLGPPRYQNLLNSLLADSWPFYLCLWIRKLNPDSHSIFWCDAYLVVELGYATSTIRQVPSDLAALFTGLLGMASAVLGLVTIYVIRAELLKHYNEREPIGLYLGSVMTFFFSFLYFQSQLYEIALFKKSRAEGYAVGAGRTLLP